MKNPVLATIVGAILLALLAFPANAQNTRTWVSGDGADANPCSRTAPCKTFANAISKTAASGEINCLDPGGFGALTITKAITIKCDGVSSGGVLVNRTNAITVAAAAGDSVYLSGLDLDGLAPTSNPGLNGIQISSGSRVYIINCSIRNFATNGILVNSSTNPTRVVIKDSVIANNGSGGNTGGGVNVQGSGGAVNVVDIFDTMIDGNANFAVQATDPKGTVNLARSYLTGSPAGLNLVNGANGFLIGPSNVIAGSINGATTPAPFK
jgi:hypothetical protein